MIRSPVGSTGPLAPSEDLRKRNLDGMSMDFDIEIPPQRNLTSSTGVSSRTSVSMEKAAV